MAVDITELVDNLKREVNAPGVDLFPNATQTEWEGNLMDAFWEAKLLGTLDGYTMDDDGSVTPISGDTDLSRELQQLVVFVAGLRCVRKQLQALKTVTRYKAGPVEYETQQSTQLLRALFTDLQNKLNLFLTRLSDLGSIDDTVIDGIAARMDSWGFGDTFWVK